MGDLAAILKALGLSSNHRRKSRGRGWGLVCARVWNGGSSWKHVRSPFLLESLRSPSSLVPVERSSRDLLPLSFLQLSFFVYRRSSGKGAEGTEGKDGAGAVSYTRLKLPTNSLV